MPARKSFQSLIVMTSFKTAVFTASLTGEFLYSQIIYQGKTERSCPNVFVPTGWVFGTVITTGQMKIP